MSVQFSPARVKPNVWCRTNLFDHTPTSFKPFANTVYLGPNFYQEPNPPEHIPLDDIDVIVTFAVHDSLHFLDQAPKVQWIHSLSVGVESLRPETIKRRDIVVTNSRGCTAVPIAEHVLAAMLGWVRGFPHFYRFQQRQTWKGVAVREITGSIVGIVGYGSIGKEIAKRCKSLGMSVIACRNHTVSDPDVDHMVGPDMIDWLLGEADFVVNCLPGSAGNDRYFDKAKFSCMRQQAVFINVGRGSTVDEMALVQALESGRIEGAVLDVFATEPLPKDHPLWTLDNVVITPHYSYASPRNTERLASLFAENLKRYCSGLPLLNEVNMARGY